MIPQPIDPHKIERARTERFDCWFASGWRTAVEPLLDRDPEHWAEWQQVKHSTVRTIYRGELDDGHGGRVPVHLKLFRAVRLSDRARDALGGSRSTREFANLLGAIGRGIRCVEPVAAGTLVGTLGSRSFLLTRTCPGRAMPRHGFSATDAAAAGALLRCAHDAGLHARDLHPGNLLVHPDGGAVLLDLTSALLAEPLDSAHRARALAFFCLDLDGNLRDRTAQQLRARYGAPPELVAAAVQIGRRLRARALESFGRRAFRNCRSTAIERAPRQPRIYLHTGARDLWDDARAALAALDGWTPLKSGRRGAVYLEGNLAVKARTAADARRLFRAAYWLQFAGVPAATPVALWTFQRRGAAAARRLPFPDLGTQLRDGLASDPPALLRAAQQLGSAVGRLHGFGLRNRDMKLENLILDPRSGEVVAVDLDGVRRQSSADGRGRAADLGRLLAAFRDAGSPGETPVIRAFLRHYVRSCRALGAPVRHRARVLRDAEQRAGAWARRHAD